MVITCISKRRTTPPGCKKSVQGYPLVFNERRGNPHTPQDMLQLAENHHYTQPGTTKELPLYTQVNMLTAYELFTPETMTRRSTKKGRHIFSIIIYVKTYITFTRVYM